MKQAKVANSVAGILTAAKVSNKYAKVLESDGYCDAESLMCLDVDTLIEEYKMKKQEATGLLQVVR
jgi:hypothetical protein